MARQRRRGPKLPFARMERAVELRFLGYKWGEIEKATNTPHSTLMRWYATEDWKAMEADWLAHDPLVRRAKAVLGKALLQDLLGKKSGRPDTSLAERILALRGSGEGPGGYMAHPGVVLLPMQNKGLESRPPTQVLMPPPAVAPRGARPRDPEKGQGIPVERPKRRRAAGLDDE